ncbi:MAG: DUF4384 domain-containing protein [Hyphomicrobium sp.]
MPVPTSTSLIPGYKLPQRPDEPRAAKAFGVLETHCARCHQTGLVTAATAAGGFANVLALDEIAADPALIVQGSPDASKIIDILMTSHADAGVFDAADDRQPVADDIEAVRDWIRDLRVPPQTCNVAPLRRDSAHALMREALLLEREGSADVRFISLAHLARRCVPASEIAASRNAITRLLNGLSWTASPQTLTALDPAGALLSFRLKDFGWVPQHWDLIVKAYPAIFAEPVPEDIAKLSGVATPMVRGDWLAATAASGELYYALLGLPSRLADVAKMNGIDIEQNIRTNRARRAVVRSSGVTNANRLIERHPGSRGGFWLSYDFANSSGDKDLFNRPLGPAQIRGVKTPFKHDAMRLLFNLPNGFLASAIFDAAGKRIDAVPAALDAASFAQGSSPTLRRATRAGASCQTCHRDGIRPVSDDFRAFVTAPSAAARDVQTSGAVTGRPVTQSPDQTVALQLVANVGEMRLLSDADNERYLSAVRAAGVDPAEFVRGLDPIDALARRFSEGADMRMLAAELDLDTAGLAEKLARLPAGPDAIAARRLQHGRLERAEINALIAALAGRATAKQAAPGKPIPAPSSIGLKIWIDQLKPKAGDIISVAAEADRDCYLTVISVGPEGKATVLFPNDFEPDNLMTAGVSAHVPGHDAPYQLRMKDKGRETIVAHCSVSEAPPTGVDHEFGRARFTVLGNWENFIRDVITTDVDLRRSPQKAERARAVRAAAERRERADRVGIRRLNSANASATPRDGRAVIVIESE